MTRFNARILKRSAACALALVIMGAAAPALAAKGADKEPELYFYPAGGWKLEKSDKSCRGTSQFNNGFLMQFSGTEAAWVDMLSLNFRQDLFKSGQDVDVTLSIPGAGTKTIKSRAQNAQTVGISLKDHKEFYKAMSKASVLDMAIDKNSFRFYLSGFNGFSTALERCLAGSSVQEALNPPPPDISVQNAQKPEQAAAATDYAANEAMALEEGLKKQVSAEAQPPAQSATEGQQAEAKPVAEAPKSGPKPLLEDEAQISPPKTPDAKSEGAENAAPQKTAAAPAPILKDTPKEQKAAAAPAPVAQPPQPPKAAALLQPAPGLVHKNGLSKEQIERMLAEQMGTPAPAPGDKAAAPAETGLNPAEMAAAPDAANAQGDMQVTAVEGAPAKIETAKEAQAPAAAPAAPETIAWEKPLHQQQPQQAQPKAKPENAASSAPAEPMPKAAAVPPAPVSNAASIPPAPQPAEPPAQASPQTVASVSSPEMAVKTETIKAQADFTQAPGFEPQTTDEASQRIMASKIADLEQMVEKLKTENTALNEDLRVMSSASKEEQHMISSENWNLEQATMRFNESERQVKKLGQQLQAERAKCSTEKKDLEAMLFDPQVTDQQQMARLAALEQELASAKQEIDAQRMRYEEQIRMLRSQAMTQ